MKYLILGSAGQIGDSLTQFLRSKNEEVLTFDIQDSISQDLRIDGVLESVIEGVDFVYFLAFLCANREQTLAAYYYTLIAALKTDRPDISL